MRLLIPEPIDKLLYTNISVNDGIPYNPNKIYNLANQCRVDKRVYECLSDGVRGVYPPDAPESWVDTGAVNAFRCVDEAVNTQTISSGDIIIEFEKGSASAVAALNSECEYIKLELFDVSGKIVWSETQYGIIDLCHNWWEYFTKEFEFMPFFIFHTPAFYIGGKYRMTLTNRNGGNKLGVALKGKIEYVGATKWEVEDGYFSYAKADTDRWGNTTLKKGVTRDSLRVKTVMHPLEAAAIKRLYRKLEGTAVLFMPTEAYDINAYGFLREPKNTWSTDRAVYGSLEIGGLI